MINRILIPLDEYHYSKTAIEYGINLVPNEKCHLDSLYIIDVPAIEKATGPVPVGGTYYAKKEINTRLDKEKKLAEEMMREFSDICQAKNINHRINVLEGEPEEIIVEESKYYDLVIVPCKTSFRYGEKFDKGIQHELISHEVRPALMIPAEYREIKKIVLCFDGEIQSIKAIQQFVRMEIWRGRDIYLLHINKNNEVGDALLEKIGGYLSAWKIPFEKVLLPGNPKEQIFDFIKTNKIDMAVMGAHGKKKLMKFIVGSTTDRFIEMAEIPLFIFH